MKKQQVRELLPLIGSKVTGYRGAWVLGPCPYGPWRHDSGEDVHPSFGIESHDTKKSLFKCFSCGMGGDLMHLQVTLSEHLRKGKLPQYDMGAALNVIADELTEMEFDKQIPDYEEEAPPVDAPFPEPWLASFKPAGAFPVAVGYLATRGIQKALYEALDLRYDPFQHRICFPFRNSKGQLMGMQGRYASHKVPEHILRYYFYKCKGVLNKHAWLGENHMNLDKPLVLVEGPFDYASVYRVYPNVVASFSSGIAWDKLNRIADASDIITFYDAGKGGDAARKLVHKYFGKRGTPVIDLVPTNEGGDPGSMTDVAEVGAYLTKHVKLVQSPSVSK